MGEDTVEGAGIQEEKNVVVSHDSAATGESSSAAAGRIFVEQIARRAADPIDHVGYGSKIGMRFESNPNVDALKGEVHRLNATRKIDYRSYDELKADSHALETYIAEAATRQSRFREQAVDARVRAKIGGLIHERSHSPQLDEDEADLHDAVAALAGEGAVAHHRKITAGTAEETTQDGDPIKAYLRDQYIEASGLLAKKQEAEEDARKARLAGNSRAEELATEDVGFFQASMATEGHRADVDYESVYGYPPAVEALIRRKAILTSDAWRQRTEALVTADNPGGFVGKKRKVDQAVAQADAAKTKAYQAGKTAVAKFQQFQGSLQGTK